MRPSELSQEALAERIESARARGVGQYDRLRLRFVERLAELAHQSDLERSSAKLRARASDRLTSLVQDFEATREQLEPTLQTLPDTAREAFERGDLRAVQYAVRRRRRSANDREDESRRERLSAQVARRSSAPPPPAGEPMLELAERLYHERCGDALTRRAVAELRVALPEDAGPYHGTTVAAAGLERLGAESPQLLRAWFQKLANLDSLRPE